MEANKGMVLSVSGPTSGQHNQVHKLMEGIDGEKFTLKDALGRFREQLGDKATKKSGACLSLCCIKLVSVLYLFCIYSNALLDVFCPADEKERGNFSFRSALDLARDWKFRIVGYPMVLDIDVFGPAFNSQTALMKLWKTLEDEIEAGNLNFVKWSAGLFFLSFDWSVILMMCVQMNFFCFLGVLSMIGCLLLWIQMALSSEL